MHDPDYRTSLKDWHGFVECLTQKVSLRMLPGVVRSILSIMQVIEVDDTIPELPVKDIVSCITNFPVP